MFNSYPLINSNLAAKLRSALMTLGFSALFFTLGITGVSAAIVDQHTSRTFVLRGDHVEVTETSTVTVQDSRYLIPAGSDEVFTVFNPIVDDKEAQQKIDLTLPTIRVVDENGNPIQFTTEVDGQNLNINIPRPTNLLYGNPQTFTVTYSSYALSEKTGAIYDMYVPSFAESFPFEDSTTSRTINTKVVIPKQYGEINFALPDKSPTDTGDNLEYQFSQQDLTGIISWIQIGTDQYYSFEIHQAYGPSTPIPLFFNRYRLTLLRDVSSGPFNQKVHYTSITPEPEYIEQDEDGNLIATFSVPANETGEIVLKGYVSITDLKGFDLTQAGNLADIKLEDLSHYIQPAQFWEVDDPKILSQATELKGEKEDVYSILSTTYQYVVDQIDYSEVKRFGINERQGALKTLEGGAAVCMEYSDLFIALMRAQGVPARAAFGYGYDARSTDGVDTAHQWAEVYMPGLDTWVMVDTTWGESGNEVIGGDLNRLYKYVASTDPHTPAPVQVSFFGALGDTPDEEFEITAIESIPDMETTSQEQLLAKYPVRHDIGYQLEGVAKSYNLLFTNIGSRLGLSIEQQQLLASVSAIVLGIILFTLLFYPLLKRIYRRLDLPFIENKAHRA